jgi:hypothetical protein
VNLFQIQEKFALNTIHIVKGKSAKVTGSAIQNRKEKGETYTVFFITFAEEETGKRITEEYPLYFR